jgi:hypothetical protein
MVLLAAPAVWLWVRQLPTWPRWWRRTSVVVIAVLALLGIWVQVSLTLEGRAFTVLADRQGQLELARFQYDLDDRLFGGRPPDVVRLDGDELPAYANGRMVILGNCSGLYRSDGFGWAALEWKAGEGRRLVLSGAMGDGPTTVASGDGWTLSLVPDGDGVRVVHHADSGVDTASDVFHLDEGPVVVDVAADPTTDQIEVSVNGEGQLSAIFVPADGMQAAPGWEAGEGAAPFCESLLERLGS